MRTIREPQKLSLYVSVKMNRTAKSVASDQRGQSYRDTRLDLRKTNPQLIANEQNQDRAQRGKNEAGGMVSFVCRARKHVANAATDDRADDAEHDCPEERYVHVHHRSGDNARD